MTHTSPRNAILWIIVSLLIAGCQTAVSEEELDPAFFNETDLNGWHIYNQGITPSKWTVNQGVLVCDPRGEGVFGDLVSDQEYEDFELEFEWTVGKGGNSGVFINVQEDSSYSAVFATGLEMQLLDNEFAEPRHQADSTHWAGCLYAVDCKGSNSTSKPHGQWNSGKIRQQNGVVTFWMNDKITFEQDINSDAFRNKVASSDMKNYPDFGKSSKGKIAFQNHTDSVSFRHIRLSVL